MKLLYKIINQIKQPFTFLFYQKFTISQIEN